MKINNSIILLSIAVSILFAHCSRSEHKKLNSLPTFDITDLNNASIVKLSDLNVKDIDYIPLETNDSSLIKHVGKIIVSEADFFVEDKYMALYRFARDGKLINQIGKQGRGPGEFNATVDFVVDSDLEQVFLLNGTRHIPKINIYTLNGDFIKSFFIPKYIQHIARLNNRIIGYCPNVDGTIDTSFILVNNSGNIIKNYTNKHPYNKINIPSKFWGEILMYKYNNQLYIKEISSDTIFEFESLRFNPVYILDFGKKSLKPEVRSRINNTESFLQIAEKYCFGRNLFETNNFIYTQFSCEEHQYAFVSFKNKEKCLLLNMDEGIENDIDGGPNIWLRTTQDDNTILSWISAFKLKQHVGSKEFKNSSPNYPEKKTALEKLANRLDENDNPVLMLVKLKN